jgi:LemA protein
MITALLWIIGIVVVVIVVWVIGAYNGLVKLRNRTDEAWSDIDVQLKRRYDLIPNLVSTVKGYAKHEEKTLTKVIEARNMAMAAQKKGDVKATGEAENVLSGALKSIFALAESYPDLKANQNFLELQRDLTDTEDKVQASRRFYNGNVRDMNTKIETFPTNLIAGMFNFKKREFFEIEREEEREAPKVSFDEEKKESKE